MTISSRAAARLQRAVDEAAQRAHDRLAADPATIWPGGRGQAATAFALAVIVLGLAIVAGLIWATAHAQGFVAWALVGVGWLLVLSAIPRPPKLPGDVAVLDQATYPAIHRLVGQLASAVGAPTPTTIGVDLSFNAYVGHVGWRGRGAMVIGLPLWLAETWEMRLGTLGHELGHLAGHDTVDARIIHAGQWILASIVGVCYDVDREDPFRDLMEAATWRSVSLERRIAAAVLRALGVGPLLALLTLRRLAADAAQLREYLADRRSALATGSAGLASGLALDVRGCHVVASAAVQRGEDPFEVLAARSLQAPASTIDDLELARHRHTWDATHPPPVLRVDLIRRLAAPVTFRPDSATCDAAARELDSMRVPLAREFRDHLIDSWLD